ncbi:purine permease [Arhodomonas aquaeolei]|nr:nucleobase:cation symporter-2 family protein [Arhodomonas aquaeolei]MCS4504512.1 purine permease [Arhodomonas aquaeolei]
MSEQTEEVRPEQRGDVDYMPPLRRAIPLSIQHVLAMFVGNVTVPVVIAGAVDLPAAQTTALIQAAMFIAGVATLVQSLGVGRIGARLPVVMGTSFGFVPVMIPIASTQGLPSVFGAALAGGVAMAVVGLCMRWVRFLFPPVVMGTFVIMIGVLLLPVGFAYTAGGFGAPDFGAPYHIALAALVFVITVGLHQFARGFIAEIGPLVGLVAGFVIAALFGLVDFSDVAAASWVSVPLPWEIGMEFHLSAIVPMVLLSLVTVSESVGDLVGITVGGADREPSERELSGGVTADGLSTVLAAFWSAFPQISFSQNVGMVALTGVISRYVVAIGGVFLLVAGLFPKFGAIIGAIPNAVLGGAVLIMFGMIASAGIKMLSHVPFSRRNMVIIGMSLAMAFGLPEHPEIYAGLPESARSMMDSGLIPGAVTAILLNLILPGGWRPGDGAG